MTRGKRVGGLSYDEAFHGNTTGASARGAAPAVRAVSGGSRMAGMNWLCDVYQARLLVTARDREYVGLGALSEVLLDLIAVSRLRGHRLSGDQIQQGGQMRGFDSGDISDLQAGLRHWRR